MCDVWHVSIQWRISKTGLTISFKYFSWEPLWVVWHPQMWRCRYIWNGGVDFNTFRVKMFYTFREPHVLTFCVILSHIASIFTFSVDIFFTFSYLFTYSGIFTFDVPQVAVSINNIKTRASREMTSLKFSILMGWTLPSTGMWRGEVFAISDCVVLCVGFGRFWFGNDTYYVFMSSK